MLTNCPKPKLKILPFIALISCLFAGVPRVMSQQYPATQKAAPVAKADATPVAPTSRPADSEAPQNLHLLVGRSLVISSPTRIKRVSLADPNIAEVMVI